MGAPGTPDVEAAAAASAVDDTMSEQLVTVLAVVSPRSRGYIFAGLFTMIMASSSLYSLLAPFFPTQAEDKGVSTMLTGVIFAVFALVVFVFSPLMGVHMAEIGQRRLMFAGLVLLSSATICFGAMHLVPGGVPFIVFCFSLRCMQGLGAAAVETSAYAIGAQLFPDKISYAMGLLEVACGMGLMIGPPVGGVLYRDDGSVWGKAFPFLVVGCLPLPCLLLFGVLLPPNLGTKQTSGSISALRDLLRIPSVQVVLAVAMVGEGSLAFLEPVLEPHVRPLAFESPQVEHMGGHHVFVGILFCVVSVHYALSVPFAGWASHERRLGSSLVMSLGLLACALAFLLCGPTPLFGPVRPTTGLAMAAMAVLGVGQGLSIVPNMEALLCASGNTHGADGALINIMAGLLNGAYSFGSMVAPIVGAFMAESIGMPWACTIWAGLLVATAAATGLPWDRMLAAAGFPQARREMLMGRWGAGPGGKQGLKAVARRYVPLLGGAMVLVAIVWVQNIERAILRPDGGWQALGEGRTMTTTTTTSDGEGESTARDTVDSTLDRALLLLQLHMVEGGRLPAHLRAAEGGGEGVFEGQGVAGAVPLEAKKRR